MSLKITKSDRMNLDDKIEVSVIELTLIKICAKKIEKYADVLQYDGKDDIPRGAMTLIDEIYTNAASILESCNDLLKEESQ